MYRNFIEREQLTHSLNPYIHKCCGCIHLRMGATISCLIWAGLSLYLAIVSFQSKSPFYSFMDNTALYIFGTINLVLFGVSLGTLIPLFFKFNGGIRAASNIINIVVFILLIDMTVNTILFIVRRDDYVSWCINSTSANLDNTLFNQQPVIITNGTATQNFNTGMADFYNCNRTWQDEFKFSVLSTIVMSFVYFYWALSIVSYTVKLRMRIKKELMMRMGMMPQMGLMLPPNQGAGGGPMSTV